MMILFKTIPIRYCDENDENENDENEHDNENDNERDDISVGVITDDRRPRTSIASAIMSMLNNHF